jgi:hypothetical protein
MATMTGEYIDRAIESKAVTQTERDWFMKNRIPPDNWRVWIGRFQRHKWKGQWIHVNAPILGATDAPDLKPGDLAQPNTQATTFVVGELYVHVMSSTGYPELVQRWSWPFLSRLSRLLIQIWPSKESFVAWPTESMTDKDADTVPTILHKTIERAARSITGRRIA